jgi:hypothetical protein
MIHRSGIAGEHVSCRAQSQPAAGMDGMTEYPVVVVQDLLSRKPGVGIAASRRGVPIADQDNIKAMAES